MKEFHYLNRNLLLPFIIFQFDCFQDMFQSKKSFTFHSPITSSIDCNIFNLRQSQIQVLCKPGAGKLRFKGIPEKQTLHFSALTVLSGSGNRIMTVMRLKKASSKF